MSNRRDRSNQRDPRELSQQSPGHSGYAGRGISHEERMRDDDSASRFPGRERPGGARAEAQRGGELSNQGRGPGRDDRDREPRNAGREEGYYGSGGSYGYGGSFNHGGEPGYEADRYRAGGDPGRGNEEFYESTGGFGHDVSGYGRQGFGYPGREENRRGFPGGGTHQGGGRGYFSEDNNRTASGRGYFNEDARQGFTQNAGYWQTGGSRSGSAHDDGPQRAGGSGYGSADRHSDGRGHDGGGRGPGQHYGGGQPARGPYYGRMPQGYTRSDERIREDVCERLAHGHIDPSNVSVKAENGVVTLEGTVSSRHDKFHVEELVDGVLGVKEVDNRLRVRRAGDAAQAGESATQPGEGQAGEPREQGEKPRNGNVNGARS
jgi:hypothetical protein